MSKIKWRPIQPIRKPDKIISSDARLRNDVTGFIPSYESEPRVNMYFLLGNEYLRQWFQERKKYEKIAYAQLETMKENRAIKRGIVIKKKSQDDEDDQKSTGKVKSTKMPVRKPKKHKKKKDKNTEGGK